MKASKAQKKHADRLARQARRRAKRRSADRNSDQMVNTDNFVMRQSFGPASEVRHIPVEET